MDQCHDSGIDAGKGAKPLALPRSRSAGRASAAVLAGVLLAGLTVFTLGVGSPARAQDNYTPDPTLAALGESIWKEAQCRNCHGGLANGIGDVPQDPQGPDLRKTKLTPDQIEETIKCGRPGTPMPHFDRRAYTDDRCYGVTAKDLGDQVPPAGGAMSQRQITAIVAFLETRFIGKPDPTYEDCIDFWGPNASTCDRYPKQ
jgi:mono/diheme cytochrome c family protein